MYKYVHVEITVCYSHALSAENSSYHNHFLVSFVDVVATSLEDVRLMANSHRLQRLNCRVHAYGVYWLQFHYLFSFQMHWAYHPKGNML